MTLKSSQGLMSNALTSKSILVEKSATKFIINVIEVLIIAAVIFYFYSKFIKNTRSAKLVRGLIFLIVFWLFGEFLVKINLQILYWHMMVLHHLF